MTGHLSGREAMTLNAQMPTKVSMPPYPAGNERARERFHHHLEWAPGWVYTTTSIREADVPPHADTEQYPGGWDYKATRPDGFGLNGDRGVGYDEAQAGWTKLIPGVLRNPNAPGGSMLIAYWRRHA